MSPKFTKYRGYMLISKIFGAFDAKNWLFSDFGQFRKFEKNGLSYEKVNGFGFEIENLPEFSSTLKFWTNLGANIFVSSVFRFGKTPKILNNFWKFQGIFDKIFF